MRLTAFDSLSHGTRLSFLHNSTKLVLGEPRYVDNKYPSSDRET